MHRIGGKDRVFLCLITLSFFILVVSLLALAIAEDQIGRQRQKPKPMLGIVTPSDSVR